MELDILDSIDNIQEDEVSNFDDCVIDKNFSKVTAEQEKPKPTCKKTVKKSTSTPLKRLTKRQSTKPSLANPDKRNGKPNNSDLELSVLNQKIGNIESILERLDLKVAVVNAVTIDGIESNSSNNQDEISSNLYTITVYKSKKKFMIQGNCRYHWVEREFTEIIKVVDEYLSQSDSRNSTLVSCYNPVFQAELELDILDSSDNIQEDEVSNFDDCVIDKNFSKVTAEQEKPKPTRKKTVKKSTSTPLKRLTKRQSTKPSLANPNKRNGKPNNSDLELSVLNQKIGNIESILERQDLKVAEVNASYIESKIE